MALHELLFDLREREAVEAGIVRHRDVRVEEPLRGRRRVESRWAVAREQARQKIRAVIRKLEQRLVHQVRDQIAAADVDDDRDLRFERGDVGEVLLGPDAQIHAARFDRRLQLGDHELQADLVRQEVVGPEVAVGLGEIAAELPQLSVAEARGDRADGLRGQRRGGDERCDGDNGSSPVRQAQLSDHGDLPRVHARGGRMVHGDASDPACVRHASARKTRAHSSHAARMTFGNSRREWVTTTMPRPCGRGIVVSVVMRICQPASASASADSSVFGASHSLPHLRHLRKSPRALVNFISAPT